MLLNEIKVKQRRKQRKLLLQNEGLVERARELPAQLLSVKNLQSWETALRKASCFPDRIAARAKCQGSITTVMT